MGNGLCRSFLKRAYRRPVAEDEARRFLALFEDQSCCSGFRIVNPCLRVSTAVLASPGLRVRRREAGPARRPARAGPRGWPLLPWNSTPDDTLRTRRSRWSEQTDALRAQVERMLDDPKSRRFVEAFTDYRLDLRKIDDISPSNHALQRLRTRRPAEVWPRSKRPGCSSPNCCAPAPGRRE